MPSLHIAGSVTADGLPHAGSLNQQSGVLMIPFGITSAKLNMWGGLDGSNRMRTQKSTDNGVSWSNVTTYNADQTNVSVTVAHGEHWRIMSVDCAAYKTLYYKLSVEN